MQNAYTIRFNNFPAKQHSRLAQLANTRLDGDDVGVDKCGIGYGTQEHFTDNHVELVVPPSTNKHDLALLMETSVEIAAAQKTPLIVTQGAENLVFPSDTISQVSKPGQEALFEMGRLIQSTGQKFGIA